ncbi:MAG TPA: UdgX family uracil-DNA binding protein [Acetobacteraceae bacterium]|nr:UdgX family uracil-DNA binding protein [Acetobacteraceae bacterium]
MRSVTLAHEVDWEGWRNAARALALEGVRPEDVVWSVGAPDDLFAEGERERPPVPPGSFTVPRSLVTLAETAIQARDPERFALLYRLIWRAHGGEKQVLEMTTDPDVQRVQRVAQSVRRDTHKMRAFLRFREVQEQGGVRYVGWFEPDHYIVEANAPFFVRRFATMVWSILTPYRSAHWTGQALEFGPGALACDVPDDDRLEAYWRAYYSSIFNPARLKVGAMTSEMPKKYWRNLPEAAAIPDLIREASGRAEQMVNQPVISPPRPRKHAAEPAVQAAPEGRLKQAAAEAVDCRRCDLWKPATQVVFGEGPADARIMMIGEQPGDQEDLAGRPFVGPAGQILDRAMAEAGLDRRQVYVTNAVKHFKFVPRGKRRIHEKPGSVEIAACKFWLEIEREEIRPAITVMLGATAAQAVLGRTVTISRERGRPIALEGNSQGFVTVHPSFLLRVPDPEAKEREYRAFVDDLRKVAALAA